MPYVSIKLDDATATALAAAAVNIASGSAFVAKTYAHLTLLGSLHTYEDEAVHRAVSGLVPTEPIPGRFLSWGISKHGSLQVLVECAPALSQLQEALHSMLPRGRPWANSKRSVTIGSVTAIPVGTRLFVRSSLSCSVFGQILVSKVSEVWAAMAGLLSLWNRSGRARQ